MQTQIFQVQDKVLYGGCHVLTVIAQDGPSVRVAELPEPVDASELRLIQYHAIEVPHEWYVTQFGRRVEVRQKMTYRTLQAFEPPAEWGRHWAWNVDSQGKGIYFIREEDC